MLKNEIIIIFRQLTINKKETEDFLFRWKYEKSIRKLCRQVHKNREVNNTVVAEFLQSRFFIYGKLLCGISF